MINLITLLWFFSASPSDRYADLPAWQLSQGSQLHPLAHRPAAASEPLSGQLAGSWVLLRLCVHLSPDDQRPEPAFEAGKPRSKIPSDDRLPAIIRIGKQNPFIFPMTSLPACSRSAL